jgi:hypothetical protein
MSTPRKLFAALDEYWYMEHIKHYEQGSFNLQFIAPLLVPDQKIPEHPKRGSEPKKKLETNDVGIAMLEHGFGW